MALEVKKMSGLSAYINREVNAIDGAVVSREIMPNGVECVYVSIDGNVLYQFFAGKKKCTVDKPKHTGGKKPYLMVVVERIEGLRDKGIDNIEEMVGFMVCLGELIDWTTGKLRHKRSKREVTYSDLVKHTGSKRKLDRLIKQLEAEELLFKTESGYFISREIVKKGADRMANRVLTYEQAFDMIDCKVDGELKEMLKRLEEDGHTERSIAYAVWKSQEKLMAFRRDSRFYAVLTNEIRKYSWTRDDPRWKEYNERKELEKQLAEKQAEIKAKRRNVRKISASL
jgi:hypothetical protein